MANAFGAVAGYWLDQAYIRWVADLHVRVRSGHAISLRMDLAENAAVIWTQGI